jgi:hypothetical protein
MIHVEGLSRLHQYEHNHTRDDYHQPQRQQERQLGLQSLVQAQYDDHAGQAGGCAPS